MSGPSESPLRRATPADVPAIVALVQSAYRGESSRVGWTTEADLLDGQRIDVDGVRDVIDREDSCILLRDDSTGVLACAQLEQRDRHAYFGLFAVRPGQQGRGIGAEILAAAERIAARDWDCTHLLMSVIDARADLIAWYERRGYRRTGQHEAFPYGDERFGIPRRDDLRFERLDKTLTAIQEPDA